MTSRVLGDLGIFARIERADIDEGGERAVGRAPEAEFVGAHIGAEDAGLDFRQRHVARRAGRCRHRDRCGGLLHGAPLDDELTAFGAQDQPLFLKVRLFHQPMRKLAQQIEMRAAALKTARPEPDVIGEEQRNAALVLAAEHQQRSIRRTAHDRRAGRFGACVDGAEPVAPGRRFRF
jgi:hypothetical protein